MAKGGTGRFGESRRFTAADSPKGAGVYARLQVGDRIRSGMSKAGTARFKDPGAHGTTLGKGYKATISGVPLRQGQKEVITHFGGRKLDKPITVGGSGSSKGNPHHDERGRFSSG